MPGNALFSIALLSTNVANEVLPEGLRLKLGSDIFEITTTGSRNFGGRTITIRIPYDPSRIAQGEQPVMQYYDEIAGKWVALYTTVEKDPVTGKWYAVVQVNHLTKFAVFSKPVTVINLVIGRLESSVNGKPYTLDAQPFVDTETSRTLVPVRFVSEALGAAVEWVAETGRITIKYGGRVIVLSSGSSDVTVNGVKQTIDCAPAVLHPGRTFAPLRFVSEALGARVEYNSATRKITITK